MILGGGRVTSKEKVPKNNNFFSDPFPKKGFLLKTIWEKTSNDKENDFAEEIFCLSQSSRTI